MQCFENLWNDGDLSRISDGQGTKLNINNIYKLLNFLTTEFEHWNFFCRCSYTKYSTQSIGNQNLLSRFSLLYVACKWFTQPDFERQYSYRDQVECDPMAPALHFFWLSHIRHGKSLGDRKVYEAILARKLIFDPLSACTHVHAWVTSPNLTL